MTRSTMNNFIILVTVGAYQRHLWGTAITPADANGVADIS